MIDIQKLKNKDLESTIIALEMDVSLLENDLSVIDLDLKYFENRINDLEYNYSFLKKEGIIVSIAEYKRTVIELGAICSKIKDLKTKVNQIGLSMSKKMKDLDLLYRYFDNLNDSENVLYLKGNKIE